MSRGTSSESGTRPGIGDFGLMGPLYAHLGRDPVPKAIMQTRTPAVYEWLQRMNELDAGSGEFLAEDEIPDTLVPILKTLCRDFLPDALDVIRHNAAWLEENPGENLPRYLGMHAFRTGDTEGTRVIHSYSQWLFQRAWSHYRSLAGEQRESVDALLEEVGGLEAMQVEITHRLRRQPGQLELVETD